MAQAGASSKAFQASRVVGSGRAVPAPVTPTTPARPTPAPVTPARPAPPPYTPAPQPTSAAFTAPTRPGFSATSLFGAALLVLSILGIILNATLPWVWVSAAASGTGEANTLDKDETQDQLIGSSKYGEKLVDWPLLTFVFGIIVGIVLVVIDLIPMIIGLQRIIQVAFLTAAAYFSFLLALTGFRWFGWYVTTIWNTGDSPFHLSAVPYLNLVLGLSLFLAATYLLVQAATYFTGRGNHSRFGDAGVKVPAWTALAIVGALLLMPMLPFATLKDSGFSGTTSYLGEKEMDDQKEQVMAPTNTNIPLTSEGKDAGQYLGYARLWLWLSLFFCLIALPFALAERSGRLSALFGVLTQTYGLIGLLMIVGLIHLILFITKIPKIEGPNAEFSGLSAGYWLNWFPVIGYLAVVALYVTQYVPKVLLPFGRSMAQQGTGGGMGTPQ